MAPQRSPRRAVYREAKKTLYSTLRRRWHGSSADLRRVVQAWLKGKNHRYLRRLVQQHAFALAVAGALLVGGRAFASPPVELSDVAGGLNGFVINGASASDQAGDSVSVAGDVNGDGLDDLIVGAGLADPNGYSSAGTSYVVFGKASGVAVALSGVESGTGGFAIVGIDASDFAGISVSGAGDVNGDGNADLIVGASGADPSGLSAAGASYVVFGKADGAPVELVDVALGLGGFLIEGINPVDVSGVSVSGAGDVNGDGFADLIVGAPGGDPNGDSGAGESFVVFGKPTGTPVDLLDVAFGNGGFVINGVDEGDSSGVSVSAAGDVNGDGLADLIVGAHQADPYTNEEGESYVVFGKIDGTAVNLSGIAAGFGGFVINGVDPGDLSGQSVSGAGDVNGDGLADLVIGARYASPNTGGGEGESYVVFGKSSGTPIDLSDVLVGAGGFVVNGIADYDYSGSSVSGAGDVNGDGLADIVIGAPSGFAFGGLNEGESYVVFGKANGVPVELSAVALGAGGFILNGADESDFSGTSVAGMGDVNGDGLSDVIVSAPDGDPGGLYGAGESYVVFSAESAPGTATYFGYARAGDGIGGQDVPRLKLETARIRIDYSDDDSANNGAAGASLEEVTLHRSSAGLSGLPVVAAEVYWETSTDRQNWTSATMTFKYLDSDVAGVNANESELSVFAAASTAGPWTELATSRDAARNRLTVTTPAPANARVWAIGAGTPGETSLGDVNGDGGINSTDALWMIQSEFGLRDPLPLEDCDLNNDGQCNSTDALWVTQIEFGLRPAP